MNESAEQQDPFETELRDLINRHSKEKGSNTPDFVLADYLTTCLKNFDYYVRYREDTKATADNPMPETFYTTKEIERK